ncbi:MAG: hypothetical protein U1F56_17805 [Rubrivivax sp.]
MTTVSGVGPVLGLPNVVATPAGPLSVAAALSTLKLQPGSTVEVSDTLDNIQKNLDALQAASARITSLVTTSDAKQLSVSAAQYAKHDDILALWGIGSGQTVEVTQVSAGAAAAFVAAKPDWVTSITVADANTRLQRNLDSLQALAAAGTLRQIVQTGPSGLLKITAAQMSADADALGLIKNGAYSLALTEASVSDTLGLGANPALTANARVKSIEVKDTTAAIEDNLDALQRVGFRLKSVSQTDSGDALTLTGEQVTRDAALIGKILTPYQLDVIRASAAQTAKLVANQKVVSVAVADSAANIARKWNVLQRLADSLASVEVTDPDTAIEITGAQFTLGADLLATFVDDAQHGYHLAVSGVRAGQATEMAADAHVTALRVLDTADNIAAQFDALKAVDDAGLLADIALAGRSSTLTLDASRLLGDALTGTQAVLSRIGSGHYGLSVTGVGTADLAGIAADAHVLSIELTASSDQIESSLDAIEQLGKRVARIQQSDSGTALDLTQADFAAHGAVLGRIDGGYSLNLSAVSASRALALAMNSHVASIAVADSGRNLVANWSALRAAGATLASVSQTDDGALRLTAADYLVGASDGLLDRFADGQTYAVRGASVAQLADIAADAAVEQIEVSDDGSAVVAQLDTLSTLAGAGRLSGVVLNTGATSLSLHASQIDGAQGVLDLIRGGRYTLAVDEVDVADVDSLLSAQPKIARLWTRGDAAAIAEHLDELGAAGRRLVSIVQTDGADTALALTGAAFDTHRLTLAKIAGGYQVDLSEVAASKAATLAAMASVHTLQVADDGAALSSAWNALAAVGAKLTDVAQSDDALLRLTASQYGAGAALAAKFSTTLGVAVSAAAVADLATLGADSAVQEIRVTDHAGAIVDGWADLAAETKLAGIRLTDPTVVLDLAADTYAASADLLALMQDSGYQLALSDVAVTDAATVAADTHVVAMDVLGSAADVGAAFDTLAGLATLRSITLGDDNGTLTLSASQVLTQGDTLALITNAFQVAATGVALADLADVQAVDEVSTIAVSDSAANVSDNFADLLALGSSLASITLSDATPVLQLTQAERDAGSAALAGITGSWQVDLSAVEAGSVTTLAANDTVRSLAVSDGAAAIAQAWSALVAAYADGSGKLAALELNDAEPLTLTEAQQSDGAALIAALLPDETIVTAP